ncbi:uncharacterized protein LOC114939568 [Nylanderia fulva]|uniref:uncharacterized protein LOC114939568 n=1 Tax=Nylanderia fulva TaxID=613905 RepID=UPI0010FB137B|nr:uncharacterized protein LOC114939568 [Nylanderia fulva]
MFAAIFTFALLVAYAAAAIPSYINVCGRRDPNLERCILDNINNIKPKICEGIPELDIPPNDPLILEKLVISETANNKLYMRDTKITGLCDFTINDFNLDMNTLHFDAKVSFGRLLMNSTYDFDVRLLVPIAQKGLVYITTDSVAADVNIDMKIITKSGTKYMYLSQIKINLDIKDYDVKYDLNESDLGQLNEVIRNLIGNNQREIIDTFKPALEEIVSKRILLVSNDIVKHFTYEELFPDRT